MRRIVLALAVIVVGACSSATTSATSEPATAVASATPSTSAEPSMSPVASASAVPAIVGEWVGTHDCARIAKMLTDAGLEEFLADAIYGNGLVPSVDPSVTTLKDPSHPCVGAVPRAHSHSFTADGQFGSKDFNGQQVDDGSYRLEGDDVIVIGDQSFRYSIDGDELTLEPPTVDISGCSTKECRFAAAWVLMVAMPGTTWRRGAIPVS